MSELCFAVSIATEDETGNVVAVYFQIRRGKSYKTEEYADGAAFADYNRKGELLGIELLGPCKATIVDQLASNESAMVPARAEAAPKPRAKRTVIKRNEDIRLSPTKLFQLEETSSKRRTAPARSSHEDRSETPQVVAWQGGQAARPEAVQAPLVAFT